MADSRICTICDQEKSLTDFAKLKHGKDGHRAQCKTCINRRARAGRGNDGWRGPSARLPLSVTQHLGL